MSLRYHISSTVMNSVYFKIKTVRTNFAPLPSLGSACNMHGCFWTALALVQNGPNVDGVYHSLRQRALSAHTIRCAGTKCRTASYRCASPQRYRSSLVRLCSALSAGAPPCAGMDAPHLTLQRLDPSCICRSVVVQHRCSRFVVSTRDTNSEIMLHLHATPACMFCCVYTICWRAFWGQSRRSSYVEPEHSPGSNLS